MASAELNDVICCTCLNIPTDSVTLKCGHIFCWACIDHLLNSQEQYGFYTCPECTEEFQERPVPQRNLQMSPESKQVEMVIGCTYCIHSTANAVTYCAMCEAFLSNEHLTVHTKSAEHVLSEPSTSQENRRCLVHKKVSEYYSIGDNVHICEVCKTIEPRGHQLEALSNAKEKDKNKKALEITNAETDARIQSLQEHVKNVEEKAINLTEKVTSMLLFTRTQLDDLEKKILSEITSQRQKASHSVFSLILQLELEKKELLKKICHIEELYNMDDPVLLQDSIYKPVEVDTKEESSKLLNGTGDLDEVLITLMLNLGLHNIMKAVTTRTDMQEPADLLLDIDTASSSVHVSEDRKTASRSQVKLERPGTPGRFQNCQVLSTTSFSSGRHYWEMETSRWTWKIGVCYPSMDRKGDSIGYNKKSWSLVRWYNTNKYRATHDSKYTEIDLSISCHRFGIYLDYDAGKLSFYALCDPVRHLHTFNVTFTEPLHAVFWVWGYSMLYKDIWVRIARYQKL